MKDYKQPENKNRKKIVRLTLFVLLGALLIPAVVLAIRKATEVVAAHSATPPTSSAPTLPKGNDLFPVACSLLPDSTEQAGSLTAATSDGAVLRYSINTDLQQRMQSYFSEKRPPYALFIALEPSTGRIISLASSSTDPGWDLNAAYRLFPMASLFKMVTAAAALEQSKITPTTEMAYRGKAISENPNNWDPRPKGPSLRIDMSEAMGKSINPVYGKLASDYLGKEILAATCNTFGFNRALLHGIPVAPSQAVVPDSVQGLRLMGSGLDHQLKISPLHAAAITAAFANNGVMMTPRLVDSVVQNGKEQELAPPHEIARIVRPEVAEDLKKMMLTTVTTGTSAKAFRTGNGQRLLTAMRVAAKTGTINGDAPAGQHTWFAAYAPADKPRIALLALVINDGRWKIKASNVGEHALTSFFRQEVAQVPAPPVQPLRSVRQHQKKHVAKTNHSHTARKKTVRSSRRGKAA